MKQTFTMIMILATYLSVAQDKTELPILFPEPLEIELALSSLPKHLRSEASVYVYKRGDGHVLKKQGTNGFTALVERVPGFPTAFAPVSYDAEGTRTHIPRIIDQGKWIEEGKSAKEIRETVAMKFARNEYSIPRAMGISYMLSPTNILPSPLGKPALYYPHYMIYAPYAKPEELGLPKFGWHSAAPTLLDQGPHAVMVIRLGTEESAQIREDEKELVAKMEKFLDRKLSSFEVAITHSH
ncbi:MAG: hypothetical protein RLN86_03245 [Cyclobacteriaceae bacterium]